MCVGGGVGVRGQAGMCPVNLWGSLGGCLAYMVLPSNLRSPGRETENLGWDENRATTIVQALFKRDIAMGLIKGLPDPERFNRRKKLSSVWKIN